MVFATPSVQFSSTSRRNQVKRFSLCGQRQRCINDRGGRGEGKTGGGARCLACYLHHGFCGLPSVVLCLACAPRCVALYLPLQIARLRSEKESSNSTTTQPSGLGRTTSLDPFAVAAGTKATDASAAETLMPFIG